MAVLLLDKVDFRVRNITKGKEAHYIMIRGSEHQEDVMILMCIHQTTEPQKYMKQKPIQKIDRFAIMILSLIYPFSKH